MVAAVSEQRPKSAQGGEPDLMEQLLLFVPPWKGSESFQLALVIRIHRFS